MKRWTVLLLAILLLTACGSTGNAPNEETTPEVPAQSASAPQGLAIQNAQSFYIQYLDDGVRLLIDSAGRELLLVPLGTQAPVGYEDAMQVATPIHRAMFTSSAYISFLESLENDGLYASIAALTAEESQWTNPAVLEGFASGQVTYISSETWTAGDAEVLTALALDMVFLDTSQEEGAALAALLDQAGIPYVVASLQFESCSEAHLEWLKFFAAFYGLDQEAASLYDAKLERLGVLYTQGAAVPESRRPVVAFGVTDNGAVSTQAGGSTIARQLERAGAVYALQDLEGQGEIQMTMEEFQEKCKDADILIYDALPQDMPGTLLDADPLFAEFKAYHEGRVFTLDGGYYKKSAQAVEQFEDLLAICHPELAADHVFTIYQPLVE